MRTFFDILFIISKTNAQKFGSESYRLRRLRHQQRICKTFNCRCSGRARAALLGCTCSNVYGRVALAAVERHSSSGTTMADNTRLRLEYHTPDRGVTRLRSRGRALGFAHFALATCVVGGSLADWLGLLGRPGVTLVMSFVVIIATATLFIGRLPPPGSSR
jgi:hypothetical protein